MASRTPLAWSRQPILSRPCSKERLAFGAPFPGSNFVTGQFTYSAGNATSFTASYGPAAANRSIVAIVLGASASAISSVFISGVAASAVVANNNGTNRVTIWIAPIPTGTSGTITFAGLAAANAALIVYAIYANSSQTAAATATTNTNGGALTMSAPANSFIIAAGMSNINANSCTWAGGVTRDVQSNPVSGIFISSASEAIIAAASVSPAGTFGSPNNPTFAAAVWGP